MELKVTEWTVLLCLCAFGIQSSLSIVQQIQEMEQNCVRDGGYCINVIPPPPPRRRNQPGRRGGRQGRGRGQATRTRTGARPDPRAVAAQHTRLPGSPPPGAGAAPGGPPGGPPAGGPGGAAGRPAYQPPMTRPTGGPPNNNRYNQQSGYPQQPGQTQNTGLFGSNPNDPFGSLFGMMMFSRKKRQAPAEPLDPAEQPRIRRGQRVFTFLSQHCRKSEFDFGCRREGGMCCLPFLK